MAQSGYTPIQLYYSTTAAAVPVNTNLASGELALNIQDEKLYFKNAAGTVKLLASNATSAPVTSFSAGTTGLTPSTATTGAVTLAGTLATTNGGTGLTSFTSGGVVYASSASALATGSALTFDGSNLSTTGQVLLENNKYIGFKNTTGTYAASIFNDTSNFLNFYNSGNTGTIFYVNAAEQMRLTSTGLGIGTSSPSAKLTVVSTYVSDTTVQTRFSDNTGGRLEFGGNASAGKWICANDSGTATAVPLIFQNGSNVERMRLDTAGNLGIGTSSPSFPLEVVGGARATTLLVLNGGTPTTPTNTTPTFFSPASGVLGLVTNGSERLRIDSSGNVGIGTSSPGQVLDIQKSQAWATLTSTTGTLSSLFKSSNTGGSSYFGRDNSTGGVLGSAAYATVVYGSGAYPMTFHTNDTERARISAAGGFSVGTTADPGAGAIYATGNITAYYSDARLKTVSGKIENALDKVAQLSGVYYTNNETAKSFGYDSDEVQVGVLAQDVEAVLPQIVKAAPFDLDADGNSKSGENYKTVQYERLVPLLIEAINELQAKVKALEAK